MTDYDTIIIGGGPGGSTAASALARQGQKVLILEREQFPRFHIGESLIPFGNEELREIGVWDKLESGNFMPKLGAEFVLGNSAARSQVVFGKHLPEFYAGTYQVERSRFDKMLVDHAASLGAEVRQGVKVESASVSDDGVKVTSREGDETKELSARWLIDASGRDAFLGRQFKLAKTDLGLPKKFATFAHFKGVFRNPPPADGFITVIRLDFGWFWIIPLDAEKTSVGLVQTLEHFKSTGMTPEECFEHVISSMPEPMRRLEKATRVSDYYFAGDYTYRHLQNAGPRWLLVGDAAGFIDPIFSSGVMLAIKSGYLAATEILAADRADKPLSVRSQRRYTKQVGKMCTVFLRMIKMFYNNHAFEVFMTAAPAKMECAVNNLVAGNTSLCLHLRIRVWFFYAICFLQRWVPIVPRLSLGSKVGPVKMPEPAV